MGQAPLDLLQQQQTSQQNPQTLQQQAQQPQQIQQPQHVVMSTVDAAGNTVQQVGTIIHNAQGQPQVKSGLDFLQFFCADFIDSRCLSTMKSLVRLDMQPICLELTC